MVFTASKRNKLSDRKPLPKLKKRLVLAEGAVPYGTIRIAELFAGVGGFRIGTQRANEILKKRGCSDEFFNVTWSNQWEPGAKRQWASEIYCKRFNCDASTHSNEDIEKVLIDEQSSIPHFDMLVGGFPCQDYSVAKTLNQSKGIEGKKGVLWWSIYKMLETAKSRPDFVLLENVDRLIKSPSKQRGRDFAIILACLNDLGYAVEWRIINAADYGMPQRRRRIFILGYHQGSSHYKQLAKLEPSAIMRDRGVLARAFPCKEKEPYFFSLEQPLSGTIQNISEKFNHYADADSPFENAGFCVNRAFSSIKVVPDYHGTRITLGSPGILESEDVVPSEYFIDQGALDAWMYLKGGKKEKRKNKTTGHEYDYAEGSLPFPDPLDRPARTIITSEGGASPSRFKHVIETPSGRYRRLMPIELERLNMFPVNHTAEAPDKVRAFLMGNALVCGIPERIFVALTELL